MVLAVLKWRSCFVDTDHILNTSKMFDDHLPEVFDSLRNAALNLKSKKRHLFHQEVPIWDGIRSDPAKTEKVQRFPTPVDATKVHQFLYSHIVF